MSSIVTIAGPTGVGKTALSIALADRWGCPIVNCDARQIYGQLPIGTAAPSEAEQKMVKHYLVGTHQLEERYNAGDYERDAVGILTELFAQSVGEFPFAILAGGSMLYMDAVCHGLDAIPSVPIHERERLRHLYDERGIDWLREEVRRVDPDYWAEVDRSNPQRLLHCLEVSLNAPYPYSHYRTRQRTQRPWEMRHIALTRPREELYQRIDQRVDKMMADGLLEEAKRVYERYGKADGDKKKEVPNSLRTVGYTELFAYLNGECTLERAVDLIKQNTRHYAKRQMTWLRKQKDLHWIDVTSPLSEQIKAIEKIL